MSRFRTLILIVALPLLALAGFALWRGGPPSIQPDETLTAVGGRKLLSFSVKAPAGVSSVRAYYVQAGKQIPLGSQQVGPRQWFSAGNSPQVVHFSVQGGRLDHADLVDGPATLVVEANAANLRGSSARWEKALAIRSTPPRILALSSQHYLNQGGCELVVYRVTSSLPAGEIKSGVEMGGVFFPGYPMPAAAPAPSTPGATPAPASVTSTGDMFALFAYPYNAAPGAMPRLIATDTAGNEASSSFWVKTFPQTFRERTLDIDDAYIERVVVPIIQQTPSLTDQGDPLKDFLLVNRDLRKTNTQELIDASRQSAPQFLWHGKFVQLGNSMVEAEFADHRSYRYQGRIVDQEDHLGYDLAAIRHTPVLAANDGQVVWARYFGIYGNAVLIDHGYGLMSLYAHLNDFQVKAGDEVKKGQLIAHSDSTGLAGGDHLHFSMLLDGVQVNPKEWWDEHWIHDRIESKIPALAPPPPPTP